MKTPYEKYLAARDKLEAKLTEVSKACTHTGGFTTKTPFRGGEFDNQYYNECKCNYCGKWWVEDQ